MQKKGGFTVSKRRDLFARISLDYADHPKIAGLSDAAFRAHVEMILYARRFKSDGEIVKQIAKRWPEQALNELLNNDDCAPSLRIDEHGNYWLHGFAEMQETRAEIEHKRRVRAEAGRKGGRARAKQVAKQPASNLLSKTQAETETETETETEVNRSIAQPQAVERVRKPTRFDEFWATYPRRVGKDRARTAYTNAARRATEEQIITGAHRLANDPNLPEKQFIPHPTTWLNRGGWDDEPLPPRTDGRGPSRLEQNINVARQMWEAEQQQQRLEIEQ